MERSKVHEPAAPKRSVGALVLGLCLLGTACSNTERVTLGVCGNHVLEQGEDCDGTSGCSADCHVECGADSSCPAGLGCDRTLNVCHGPSGDFTQTTLLPTSQTQPLVADFDGDGRDDLLLVSEYDYGSTPSTVYYFDPGVAAPTPVSLPVASGAATLPASVSASAKTKPHADVVLGGDALYAYRSLGTRRFSPILAQTRAVSEHSQLFSADLNCDGRKDIVLWEDEALFNVDSSGSTQKLLDVGFAFTGVGAYWSTVGVLAPSTPGPRACDLLAILDPTTSHVHVYGALPGDSTGAVRALSDITLVGAPNVTGLLFLDVNADGRDDLVAQATFPPDANSVVDTFGQFVAFGSAGGSFDSHEAPPASEGDGLSKRFDVPETFGVLAVGQFDDQPGLDFFSSSSGLSIQLYGWAITADFTADGRTDVAAGSLGAVQDFDLLRATPSGLFGRLSVSTNHAPTPRDTGDFDGDGQPDLLISEGTATDAEQTTLSVLFSPVSPSTARVQELGELHGIASAVAGYLSDARSATDGFSDIAALHRDSAGDLQLGLLEGGADRLLRANVASAKDASIFTLDLPTYAPVVGHFRAGKGAELAVIATALLGAQNQFIELFSAGEDGISSLGRAPFTQNLQSPHLLALDLDADGQDEIYALGNNDFGLYRFELSGGGSHALAVDVQQVDLESAIAITSADVNADGKLDLSVFGSTTITVLLADATGAQQHVLQIPHDCSSPGAHAWLQADADAARELALICNPEYTIDGPVSGVSQLSLYDVDLSQDLLTRQRSQTGPVCRALAVGDFNGDGVEDLASSGGELALLLGKPR